MTLSLDPRALRILLAVHRAGSFTAAADLLAMSQPSVSVAIRQLEDRAGLELVHRDRKGAELTEAGLQLAARAKAIENLLVQAEREIAGHRQDILGPLRIASTPGALLALMPQVVGAMRARGEEMVIEATEAKDEDLVPMLRGRSIDLALCTALGNVAAPDVRQTILRHEPFCMVCAPATLPGCRDLTVAEAAELPWVMPLAQGATRPQLEAVFLSAGVAPPRNVLRCDSLAAMKAIVRHSDFVTLLPESVFRDELAQGQFRQITLSGGPPPRALGLLTLAEDAPTAAVARFLRTAEEVIGQA